MFTKHVDVKDSNEVEMLAILLFNNKKWFVQYEYLDEFHCCLPLEILILFSRDHDTSSFQVRFGFQNVDRTANGMADALAKQRVDVNYPF